MGAPVRIDWREVDPFLAGPYSGPEGAGATAFEVPGAPPGGLEVGRLRAGPRWPGCLAAIDRLAAVPEPDVSAGPGPDDAVLYLERSNGERLPLCSRGDGDRVRWSVDPARWIAGLLTERYVEGWTRPLPSRLPLLNYTRVPNAIKGALQPRSRLDANRSNPIAFPSVPLDDLVETLRKLCMALASGGPVRPLPLWPEQRRAAVTLTHDVDTSWILEPRQRPLLDEILESETGLGYRGAWYVTANQLDRARHGPAVDAILEADHEIGAHGWNHDAKLDFLSASRQRRRLERARQRFAGLDAPGIRTPWYCRGPQLVELLGEQFSYSSSVPNASAFFSSRSNSGCCTVFPYRPAADLLELPLTLPPDTAGEPGPLYELLERLADRVIELGGVVVITLHPQPHQSANEAGLRAYAGFLRSLAERRGGELWQATPSQIVDRYREALGGG